MRWNSNCFKIAIIISYLLNEKHTRWLWTMPWNILGTLAQDRPFWWTWQIKCWQTYQKIPTQANYLMKGETERTELGLAIHPASKSKLMERDSLCPFLQGTRPPWKRSISEIQKFVDWNKARERRTPESIETAKGKRVSHAKRNHWNKFAQQILIGFFRIPPCSYEVLCIFRRTKPDKAMILMF